MFKIHRSKDIPSIDEFDSKQEAQENDKIMKYQIRMSKQKTQFIEFNPNKLDQTEDDIKDPNYVSNKSQTVTFKKNVEEEKVLNIPSKKYY